MAINEGLASPTIIDPPPSDCLLRKMGCAKAFLYVITNISSGARLARGVTEEALTPITSNEEERVLAHAQLATLLLSEGRYYESHRHLYLLDRTLKVRRQTSATEMEALKRIATFDKLNR